MLKEDNQQVQFWAAIALREIGPAAVPAIVIAIKDEDPKVRDRAEVVLSEMVFVTPAGVAAVVIELRNPDVHVRRAILRALLKPERIPAEVVPVLVEVSKQDSDVQTRHDALLALGEERAPRGCAVVDPWRARRSGSLGRRTLPSGRWVSLGSDGRGRLSPDSSRSARARMRACNRTPPSRSAASARRRSPLSASCSRKTIGPINRSPPLLCRQSGASVPSLVEALQGGDVFAVWPPPEPWSWGGGRQERHSLR